MCALPIMEVDSIVTQFGEVRVHDGVSFNVYPGTIVALIGGSGTGKSTLLKEVLGLLEPTEGSIKLFGDDVWRVGEERSAEIRRRYGVLFQNGALFSALTVGENVAVPLMEQTDLPLDMINEIVELRLLLAGLSATHSEKMPSELSGGMKKRVALARALSLEPEMLFLDEPTSGLDPINARAFDSLIRTLANSLGLTVFMVTHDLDTLYGITDRVIVLEKGKLLADGKVEEVSRVENKWVRDYFSSRSSYTLR